MIMNHKVINLSYISKQNMEPLSMFRITQLIMIQLAVFLLLVGLSSPAPTNSSAKYLSDDLVIYTGQHDIVDITVPLNGLNRDNDKTGMILFFIEGDIKEDGTVDHKGLYILKNRTATLLLEHGLAAAATKDASKTAYFAAKDGLYSYNYDTNKAEKYGSITDSLIAVAAENGTGIIYVLTENKELYKVSEEGNKKDKVDDVKAEQIVMDISNNIYYYADKKAYVFNADGVKEIQGLPEHNFFKLLGPPLIAEAAPALIDYNKLYVIYPNGTSTQVTIENDDERKVTAYSIETYVMQYYGVDRKIYEYNIMVAVLEDVVRKVAEQIGKNIREGVQNFLNNLQSAFEAN